MTRSWTKSQIQALYEQPLMSLVFQAQGIHQQHFNANEIQLSTLLSIKTGACPENCGYCSQSGHHNADLEKEKLLDMDNVLSAAKKAKANGASRFCMGGAWRSPPKKAMPQLLEMVKKVRALGLETCMTLGMLDKEQAEQLKTAGLDYYNHNLDTSPEYYDKVVTTRCFKDRLDTLACVSEAGIKVCCGGIMGLGESKEDRISFLHQLTLLEKPPESVPLNRLVAIKGTPMEDKPMLDDIEFVRTIATARCLLPSSVLRLSAGRESMTDAMQALCFMAGANSIHTGSKLLTTSNPAEDDDKAMLEKLGLTPVLEGSMKKSPAVCEAV